MTKTKSTKRALLLSALSLLMCVSMLIGSTFAWFTDSVTSAGNKIQAGTLKIDLELLEKNEDGSTKWTSLKDSKAPIFNYDKWEPGYTDVKILKVENEGTLALKWVAKFVSANDLTELANVIDVYVKPSADEFGYATDRTDLSTWTKKGTVAEFVNTISETTYGNLEAGKAAYLGIALKMQESADNKYQGMDLGGAFDIMILATQYTSESDSFNNQYDANAKYDVDIWNGKTVTAPVADADGVYHITTAAELVGMMNNSKYPNCNNYQNVVLENNIDLAGRTVSGFGDERGFFDGIFDGQGYTISNFKIDATNRTYYAGLFNQVSQWSGENTVIKNLTVADSTIKGTSQVGAIVGGMNGNTVVENCKVINCDLYATKKVGSVVGYTAGGTVKDCYAENCTVLYSEKEGGEILGYKYTGSTVSNNTANNVSVNQGVAVSSADELTDAIASGAENIVLESGNYGVIDVTVNHNLTLSAAANADVKIAGIDGQSNNNSTNVTIKGVTIDNSLQTEGWYTGTAQKIKPCVGVWGGNYTFENCTFSVTGASGAETGVMSWWTTNKGVMNFTNCTFNGGNGSARGMQIYGNYDLNVTNCTFNTAKDYSIKYVGAEGCVATFKNNNVNATTNFVQTGSAPYAGANYKLVFEGNTLATGINHVYVDNAEGQTITINGVVKAATNGAIY